MMQGKLHYAWAVLVSALMMSASMGIYVSLGQMYPAMSAELGVDPGLLAMSMVFGAAGMVVSAFLAGTLMQKVDIRILTSVCTVVVMAAIAAMSLTGKLWHLYALCAVMGLFAAPVFLVAAPVLVENWFAAKKGLAMGIVMAGAGIGAAVFSMVAPMLIASVGWRMAFAAFGAIGAAMILPFTLFVVRMSPADKGLEPYGYAAASNVASADGPADAAASPAPAAGKGMSAGAAYKTVAFWLLFLGIGLTSVVNTYSAILPTYASTLGMTDLMGPIGVAFAMGGVVFPLVMGPVTDKIGSVPSIVLNSLLIVAGFVLMLVGAGVAALILLGALLGANAGTIGRVLPPLFAAQAFGTKDYVKIIGTLNASMSLFGMVGSFITSGLLTATGSFNVVLLFGAGVGAAILLLFLGFAFTSRSLPAQWE